MEEENVVEKQASNLTWPMFLLKIMVGVLVALPLFVVLLITSTVIALLLTHGQNGMVGITLLVFGLILWGLFLLRQKWHHLFRNLALGTAVLVTTLVGVGWLQAWLNQPRIYSQATADEMLEQHREELMEINDWMIRQPTQRLMFSAEDCPTRRPCSLMRELRLVTASMVAADGVRVVQYVGKEKRSWGSLDQRILIYAPEGIPESWLTCAHGDSGAQRSSYPCHEQIDRLEEDWYFYSLYKEWDPI